MRSVLKFIGLGAITTVASYSTYLVALQFFHPMTSYFIGLAVSFAIQAAMMAPFVFNTKLTLKNAVKSMVIYAAYSAMFAGLMWVTLSVGVPAAAAPLLVILVASPIQFLIGRKWIHSPIDEVRM
ncbi:MAG: hypothetical protein CMO04_19220 [Thalassospira sp.]|nr:hypothetical protein [Thalassospira sp.]HAY49566.1 hypothetical protein [Thalassospira sp.]|tara:strand:+ start:742 stop:1116 length:375 start_codon:yes stop_codon:yes gene_type:complete